MTTGLRVWQGVVVLTGLALIPFVVLVSFAATNHDPSGIVIWGTSHALVPPALLHAKHYSVPCQYGQDEQWLWNFNPERHKHQYNASQCYDQI